MTKTADLNMEDGKKLWRLTKQLKSSRYSKITLIQDDTLIHGEKADNLFAEIPTSEQYTIHKKPNHN